jgi:hypothetical protein
VRITVILAALAVSSGCTTTEPFEPSPDVDPPPPAPPPWQVDPAGTYQLATDLEVDPGDIVASTDALTASLHALGADPGNALISAAEGDPALVQLRTVASDAQLAAWITGAVQPQARLGILGMEYAVKALMKHVVLHSELVVTGGIGRHHLFPAYSRTLAIGGEPGEIVEAMPRLTTSDNGGLELGPHALSLGVGAHAWDAFDAQFSDTGGVRGALGGLTQCAYVGLEVASHLGILAQAPAQTVCEHGLDKLVAHGRAEAAGFAFSPLAFDRGDAGMDDANKDHVADSLFGGVWSLTANGTVELTATFH